MDFLDRYVWLCLRTDRHADGFVDAYFGPPEWKQAALAEEPVDPRELQQEARELLEALDGADLEDGRRRWLRAQLGAIECVTARLAGEQMSWADEVERTLGVRPMRTDTRVFEEVHGRLDAVLPGRADLRERYNTWDVQNAIPRERVIPALERLQAVLGPRAHELAAMPADESVTYELVSGKSWIAFAGYQGAGHTRIEINADLPISVVLLVGLASHEAYPGHHTERTAKDAALLRANGWTENCVAISAAPEALVTEGLAQCALEQALGEDAFAVVAEVLAGTGIAFDPQQAREVHRAHLAFYLPAVNAAFMLHEDGASTDEAEAYMRRWGLESDERAAHTVEFLTDPQTRAYVSAYPDGYRLCRAFAERAPRNFTRLLTEQLTPADLQV
jgi:hypothetical protein